MPRPFPFPLNVGTDICDIRRIFKIITHRDRSYANAFVRRIFNPEERLHGGVDDMTEPVTLFQQLTQQRLKLSTHGEVPEALQADDAYNGKKYLTSDTVREKALSKMDAKIEAVAMELRKTSQFLAGRFAAKEATMKAHRNQQLSWKQIWIRSLGRVKGRTQAPQALVRREEGSWEEAQIVPLSISHDGDYATATCLALDNTAFTATPREMVEFQIDQDKLVDIPGLSAIKKATSRELSAENKIQSRMARTMFIYDIPPEATVEDLYASLQHKYPSAKAYLYKTETGDLTGTGAVVFPSRNAASNPQWKKFNVLGHEVSCYKFKTPSYKQLLERIEKREAQYAHLGRNPSTKEALMERANDAWEYASQQQQFVKMQYEKAQAKNGPDRPPNDAWKYAFQRLQSVGADKDKSQSPLLEPEPLPELSSPPYIVVRALFHSESDYLAQRERWPKLRLFG